MDDLKIIKIVFLQERDCDVLPIIVKNVREFNLIDSETLQINGAILTFKDEIACIYKSVWEIAKNDD